MSGHEEGLHISNDEVSRRSRNYKAVRPPIPTSYEFPLGRYEAPPGAVRIVFTFGAVEDGKEWKDSPSLQWLDANGQVLGSINDGFPFP